jgi:MFS family permease
MALATAFLILWTLYAFVSGVVAVPYNDIVGRSISSGARSRMLAWRFFGGGVFALGVAAFVRGTLEVLPNLQAYALIFALAALLMVVSSALFVSAGEPAMPSRRSERGPPQGVASFLRGGWAVLSQDPRFRLFLYSQWLGGATLMALPFYVVAADRSGITAADVGLLLGAQTAGALASNPLWGKLGDAAGKLSMLQTVASVRMLPPAVVLLLLGSGAGIYGYMALFVVIGAMMNGVTIGYLGYLMEISPDDRRPAYSAYFNAMASPAALLPLLGAGLVSLISVHAVFVAAIFAALLQLGLLLRISRLAPGESA